MSGSYNRLLYDGCQYELKLKESVSPAENRLYIGAHENDLNTELCSKNENATLPNTWKAIGKRTDIESDLLYLVKATKCNHDKHTACPNSKEKRCNVGIPANPYICDRDIVPTNMKMPKSAGF